MTEKELILIRDELFEQLKLLGADLVGVTSVEALKNGPSEQLFPNMKDHTRDHFADEITTGLPHGKVFWEEDARAVIVFAVAHPKEEPQMDWWCGEIDPPGNKKLLAISKGLKKYVKEKYPEVHLYSKRYHVERGGLYLKDAAVLAGLGCLGYNNLLVTPEFGPRVRLRAMTISLPLPVTGPTVRDAIQYGVARGMYSNDAGTGYGMIAHASAKADHPVRQSLWGWGEVFLDTMIVCSITAFTIIFTGAYIDSDATSGALTTFAFTKAYGAIGGQLTALAISIFAWTTIIGMYYTCEKSVNYAFGDTERNKKMMPIYMIYYMIPCVVFYNIQADVLWAFTDIISAAYVAITIFFIYAKHKEIFGLFDDFWKRYLPAKENGENPPYVTFDCANDKKSK